MIEHLAGPWKEARKPADAVWKWHKQRAAMLMIRWDEKKQLYVAGRKQALRGAAPWTSPRNAFQVCPQYHSG
jgi:hypothetical protein